jgi:hypothetical protein
VICETYGCIHDATHYVVWGCLEGHVQGTVLCFNCMRARMERVRLAQFRFAATREDLKGLFTCESGAHIIADMLIYDPVRKTTWDASGEIIFR